MKAGVEAAVRRAKVPPLAADELAHLLDIFTSPAKFSAVDYGDEVVLSFDGAGNGDIGFPVMEQVVYQNHHGADSVELWHHDYSYKAVRTVLSFQAQMMKDAQLQTVVPSELRRDARPGPLLEARRPGRQLVAAPAPGQDRRGASRPGRGHAGCSSTTCWSSPRP